MLSRVAVRAAMAVLLEVGRVALLGAVRVVQKVVRMVLRVLAMATHLRVVRETTAVVKVQAGL